MRPFLGYWKAHDSISLRYGIWPRASEEDGGAVVLLLGRREFLEKYEETIRDLNRRGFDVYGFDPRGQGLSDRLIPNRHKGFVRNYDDYVRDLHGFVSQIVPPREKTPLLLFSHSLGGHVALRFMHAYPGMVHRAVFVSPMMDIRTAPWPRWAARAITAASAALGLKQAYVPGSGDYDPGEPFEGNLLTSDPVRFGDEKRAVEKNPDLALGGVTHGWVDQTFKSIDIISRPGYAEPIRTPSLFVGAELDRIVSIPAMQAVSRRMRHSRFVLIPGARHEILKERDGIRSKFWESFDEFIGSEVLP